MESSTSDDDSYEAIMKRLEVLEGEEEDARRKRMEELIKGLLGDDESREAREEEEEARKEEEEARKKRREGFVLRLLSS
ncbi:uncharacterized protein [Pocillopora verrucosa]|uniref:uncharacterized protein isoform X2 n=1 Tax=Pocillopora verrucosa TaxID=203993 RepID=UPI003340AEC5